MTQIGLAMRQMSQRRPREGWGEVGGREHGVKNEEKQGLWCLHPHLINTQNIVSLPYTGQRGRWFESRRKQKKRNNCSLLLVKGFKLNSSRTHANNIQKKKYILDAVIHVDLFALIRTEVSTYSNLLLNH